MKTGVVFPQTELPLDPGALKAFAQAAEDMGLDYLLTYDHVLGAHPRHFPNSKPPYTVESVFHEPFVLFGYLAGLTQRLEFVTGILILPQRQTALVAKQAAQVDFLSGGRLRLGIGVGWNHVEYEALGKEFANRGRRSEEQIALLRELWTKRLVTFKGDDESVRDAGINPLPVQQPIPIWFGGSATSVLRRMARLGDGWFPPGNRAAQMRENVDLLHSYLAEAGRSADEFGIDVRLSIRDSADTWQAEAAAWQEMGATHLCLVTMNAGLEGTDAHIAAMRRFREAF